MASSQNQVRLEEIGVATTLASQIKTAKKSKPIPPPRPPVQAGVMVVFGPHDKKDDPTLPPNRVITSKTVLPLTPSTIEVQAAGNWTDGLYPLRGNEHAEFAGAQLNTITFSGRLEPPAYYQSVSSVKNIENISGYQAGQVSGPVDVSAENLLQEKYYGTAYAAPPTLSGGTDVVMMEGGLAPPGYDWHEPHDLCMLLESACDQGEIVRIIIGDQYGFNQLISIRTFNWYYEDPDPDVINFDFTARQHRPRTLTTSPTVSQTARQVPKNYTTQDGDTLTRIAQTVYGDPSKWTSIVQSNLRALEALFIYPDGRAIAPLYSPTNESVGSFWSGHDGRRSVGKIARAGDGVHPLAYLRSGITLTLSSGITLPSTIGAGSITAVIKS